jgi:putative transposase
MDFVDMDHPDISISRQCELLNLCRSSLYYSSQGGEEESPLNIELMKHIDRKYLQCPFYGSRRMTAWLKELKYDVNRKRVSRLMRVMDIHPLYPEKKRSGPHPEHRVFPYLLKGLKINRVNHVWSTDITYIPMRKGFIYLMAIMDWYSRYVISWEVSITLEKEFCISTLQRALVNAKPEIFNTDQGSQFTSPDFYNILCNKGIVVSMDGRGRAFDNIFIERLWRSVKYEEVYLKEYEDVREATSQIGKYFDFYNNERHHQALKYKKPAEVYFKKEVPN